MRSPRAGRCQGSSSAGGAVFAPTSLRRTCRGAGLGAFREGASTSALTIFPRGPAVRVNTPRRSRRRQIWLTCCRGLMPVNCETSSSSSPGWRRRSATIRSSLLWRAIHRSPSRSASRPVRVGDQPLQFVKESRPITFVHMIVVPEAGTSYFGPWTPMPQPGVRWWIQHGPFVVAQQCDRVALDDTAQAIRRRFVRHFDPQKRHPANRLADPAFQMVLASAHSARCRLPLVPALDRKRWLSRRDRRPDQLAKDGAPMIPAAVLHDASMLSQSSPKRCP